LAMVGRRRGGTQERHKLRRLRGAIWRPRRAPAAGGKLGQADRHETAGTISLRSESRAARGLQIKNISADARGTIPRRKARAHGTLQRAQARSALAHAFDEAALELFRRSKQ